jgi:hypothetical protein
MIALICGDKAVMQHLSDEQLAVLCTALEQFTDNQPELEAWETEAPEVQTARDMMDAAEAERMRRWESKP